MSCKIKFEISCPQCLPEDSPRLPAEIFYLEVPGRAPTFSFPRGCPRFRDCPACVDCYQQLRQMFSSGQITFYHDPRSLGTIQCISLLRPLRP